MKKTVAVAIGTAFVAGLSLTSLAQASENPFGASTLDRGYQVAEGEGKCGEGKCGEGKKEGEGKCGEGKCGEGKKEGEGKCGEGKCGGEKKPQ